MHNVLLAFMNWCPGVSAEMKTISMSGLFTILGPDSLLGSVFFGDANICKFVHVWFASFNTHHLHSTLSPIHVDMPDFPDFIHQLVIRFLLFNICCKCCMKTGEEII